ncbi:GlxA family transcriptional regulator [Kitasatospora sp. NPDC058170]|uniref:GlxA family transcriptional regulator n=1 Tax=Kitasatospora sp. NPDC058170 TaxID=3346364 RepID=UPI0036DC5063
MSVIAVLVREGVPGHHLTTPGLVFGTAARDQPGVAYEVRLCAGPGPTGPTGVDGPTGGDGPPSPLRITAPWGLEGLADADTVLLPGHDGHRGEPPAAVRTALRAAAARGSRIGAVGTGVFTLAATGLLDGRRATTGWRHTEELARLHPRIEVDPAGTAVADGPFLTAAGIFGGMDVCLHLLARDHGERVAGETSRELLTPLLVHADRVREGIDREIGDSAGIGPTLRWLEARLHLPLTPADIAAHAGISVSSLNRRFRAQAGVSPPQYLLGLRLARARELLEDTDEPVERVTALSGFGSPASLRHHFARQTGTTPRSYRARHRAAGLSREADPSPGGCSPGVYGPASNGSEG